MRNDPVLVVAAHADDEVLGCGGTMAQLAAAGRAVHVLILADGVSSRASGGEELALRMRAAQQANDILGTTSLTMHALPDNRLDSVDLLDIIQLIEARIREIQPGTVFTHHYGDVNIDHRRVHEAVLAACRPQPGYCARELFFYEVASSTEWRGAHSAPVFVPNYFVDIHLELARKLAALGAYAEELRAFPHPRSLVGVETLARWRGAMVGVVAAEAFEVGRMIIHT